MIPADLKKGQYIIEEEVPSSLSNQFRSTSHFLPSSLLTPPFPRAKNSSVTLKKKNVKFYTTCEEQIVKVQASQLIGEGIFKKVYLGTLYAKRRGKKKKKIREIAFAKITSLKNHYSLDQQAFAMKRESVLAARESYILNKIKALYPQGHRGLMHPIATCEWQKKELLKTGFVFSFYNGKTLQEAFYISPKETLKVALDIAYGLKALHQHFILHNDLKPSNICLQRYYSSGRIISAHIIDFGLATDLKSSQHDSFLGSDKSCISPELNDRLINALDKEINEKSDIYSYGKLLKKLQIKDPSIKELICKSQNSFAAERPSLSKFIKTLEKIKEKAIKEQKQFSYQFNF